MHGPDLTTRGSREPAPPRPPSRAGRYGSDPYMSERDRRHAVVRHWKAELAARGSDWRSAREWALTEGGFMPADAPKMNLSVLVADQYCQHLDALKIEELPHLRQRP